MWFSVLVTVLLNIMCAENRMLPMNCDTSPNGEESADLTVPHADENPEEKVIGLKNYEERGQDDYEYEVERKRNNERDKKPCAIVVLSNVQNPSMQSLLRKYRYDANGVLIPSSVKYFIKLPRGMHASPILVPLNDKAFSPLGGFVRYYKEVPPIPQSW